MDHNLLLHRLEDIGVRGVTLSLFKSYLSNRKQLVKIGNCFSAEKVVDYGVPQGTVLGPLLFIIYINNLCNLNIKAQIITYADDTVILFNGNSWNEAYATANQGMKTVYEWLNLNLLTLNISKTILIPFSLTKHTSQRTQLALKLNLSDCSMNDVDCCCYAICPRDKVKYLGITIDERLWWNEQFL